MRQDHICIEQKELRLMITKHTKGAKLDHYTQGGLHWVVCYPDKTKADSFDIVHLLKDAPIKFLDRT